MHLCRQSSLKLQHLWAILLIGIVSLGANATEFECSLPGDTRYIRVEIPGAEHLCEVSVTYLESNRREVKWYANSDTLFCSARAYQMRDRYRELWNYTCINRPDPSGTDRLSPSQRQILDSQLKEILANSSLNISAVRSVASTPLNQTTGTLALQFFTADGQDFTRIIDDQVSQWAVIAEFGNLESEFLDPHPRYQGFLPKSSVDAATLTDSSTYITSATLEAIHSDGTIELVTDLASEISVDQKPICQGRQTFIVSQDTGDWVSISDHSHNCNVSPSNSLTTNSLD